MGLYNQDSDGISFKWIVNVREGERCNVKLPVERAYFKIGMVNMFIKDTDITNEIYHVNIIKPIIGTMTYHSNGKIMNSIGEFIIDKKTINIDYTGLLKYHDISFRENNILTVEIVNEKGECLNTEATIVFDVVYRY